MKDSAKNNEIVLTGQYLGVVEEYLPDKQTTYVKEGQIYATKTGIVKIDKDRRAIEILSYQEENRKTVKMGDSIIGTIRFLRLYSVGIGFATINRRIQFNNSYFGNIHVSHISKRFIERISDAFQITDIVRAKVIRLEENEYSLSTVENNLGVIHADCSICGTTLEKIGHDKLRCSRCGNVENRKLASDYGNVTENLKY
ncbi:MAG: exosome complex RNA-binding protein Csl4 [Candidatus Lokiarchaeota archaeon]|nr:exosome complex RNA-binding protein Csl4 [Candidatus Lokiarchaeota archaeon]